MSVYLLDTHVALWIFTNSDKLDRTAFAARFKNGTFIFHQVSTWEIQIKYQLGKLDLPQKPKAFLSELITNSGMKYALVEDKAIFSLGQLPQVHRDPFDRLLAAHALVNGWTLISADKVFEDYPVLLETV